VGLNDLTKQSNEVFSLGQSGSSDYVISSGSHTLKNIKVYDITGSLIINVQDINSSKTKIDLSNYPTGIYILKATSNENLEKIFKILKL
jgi:predicted GTPase